jgi:hypothetical protein
MQGESSMARNRKQQARTNATPGFAIEIKDDTELGLAMLIAEFADGHYQPIGVAISINEAREIAESNLRHHRREEALKADHVMPTAYVVWAQGLEGDYRELRRFDFAK